MKYFHILLFLLINTQTYSQNQVVVTELFNWIFVNFNNPMHIDLKGIPLEKIKLHAWDAEITNLKADGSFFLIPKRTGTTTLKVFKKEKNDSILISETHFNVKSLPAPVAIFGKSYFNEKIEYSSGEFKAQKGIHTELINYSISVGFPIKSYTIIITKDKELLYLNDVLGEMVDMKEIEQYIKPGVRVFFTNIIFESPFHKDLKVANSIDVWIK